MPTRSSVEPPISGLPPGLHGSSGTIPFDDAYVSAGNPWNTGRPVAMLCAARTCVSHGDFSGQMLIPDLVVGGAAVR